MSLGQSLLNLCHYSVLVQMQVIPSLLDSISTGFHIGRAGYRPSDICVSAPTGSGKTLAFVLPVVQVLLHFPCVGIIFRPGI